MGHAIKILALCLVLGSCSAKWHLKKAYEKDPTLLDSIEVVTIDTFYTDPVVIQDTFVTTAIDTFKKETTEYKYKLIKHHDTIFMDVECKTDTIVREVAVKCPPTVEVVEGVSYWWKVLVYILISLILLFALKKVFR